MARMMPDHYGDPAAEYTALRHGAGLLDYSDMGKFRVSGPGAAEFLNYLVTRDILFLLEDRTANCLMLRADGSVVGEVLVYNLGDAYWVEVWPAQREAVRAHLLTAAEGAEGVEVHDESEDFRVLAVEGPEAFRLVQTLVDFPISVIAYRSFVRVRWNGRPLLICRTGVTGEYGYKVYVEPDMAEALWQHLTGLGAVPCGLQALNVCRMEARFVNLEDEAPGDWFTPFDVGLQWMLDFNKDFQGKEALAELRKQGTETEVVLFAAPGRDPLPRGATVLAGEEPIGRVTHSLYSPGLDKVIGVAAIRSEFAASGLELHVKADGQEVPIVTCSSPFRVPTSLSVRMR